MAKRGRNLDAPAVLFDHVRELQKRLLVCAVVLMAAGTGAYFVYNQILGFLVAPLHEPLYYSTPMGSFSFIMRICLIAGLLFAVPTIIYNLVAFLKPAFTKVLSTGVVFFTTIMSIILALAGVAFGYFLILPGALKFFTGFQINDVHALISADSYLNFVIGILLTFLLIFQVPLLMNLIDRIKPLKLKTLFKMEKWVVLFGLLVALVVPFAMDITTCLLIAGPIVALYNFSILLIMIQHAIHREKTPRVKAEKLKKEKKQKKAARVPTPALAIEPQLTPAPAPTPVVAARQVAAPKKLVDVKPLSNAEAQEQAVKIIATVAASQKVPAHLQTTSPRVYARRVDMVVPRRSTPLSASASRPVEPATVLPTPSMQQKSDPVASAPGRLISDFRVQ